jgi:phosphoglycolate phosphatase-like HAD superfamily hydrolase
LVLTARHRSLSVNSNVENDYLSVTDVASVVTRFLEGSGIEIVGELPRRARPQHVLFDFDGTLSLIREGWPQVMIPMMVEILQDTGTSETTEELHAITETFVMELNGKQTIYQMMRLAEEVARRGGHPKEPLAYKEEYHRRLRERIESRREALRGGANPDELLVPGSINFLQALKDREVQLHLASGTDEAFVSEEAGLLGLDPFFGDHIHGALDDHKAFSKAMVIERILMENRIDGAQLVGFGDGYVEIQNIREAGGLAIAVASDEAGRSGKPDEWKRNRLIGAGAHMVIPDFQESDRLVEHLFSLQRD